MDICDSIRPEFDQVPTSHEPLFGLAIQVIKLCYILPTHKFHISALEQEEDGQNFMTISDDNTLLVT